MMKSPEFSKLRRSSRDLAVALTGLALVGCASTSPDVSAEQEVEKYPSHEVVATVYWAGEPPTEENGYISNLESEWSSDTVADIGGVDEPEGRNFEPLHNPYYFAVPAMEFTEEGLIEGAYDHAPWDVNTIEDGESLFRGRWAEVQANGKVVYAQWHDVGPCVNEQPECFLNYGYVFGTEQPINTFGEKAGIDLSPDAAKALGIEGSGSVEWKFVDEEDVPVGEWSMYPPITNKTNW